MATIASPRNFSYYLRKGYLLSDLTKKIFSGNYYHSNTSYYKTLLSQYTNFSNYTEIFAGSTKLSTIHTCINIQQGILGANARAVTGKYGKPDFIFTEKSLSIYVYKWRFNGLKTRCEVHLYNDKVFLVNYVYNQLAKHERDYIVDTIAGKYLEKCSNRVDLMHSKISDNNNNVLMVDDFLMGLKITYLSTSESDWYERMISEINEKKARYELKIKTGERRLYNKL
ncbi:hypothetical protein [Mucilaginibacter sp.]|jgi:hypothetical protein|uniref:hypothetical protein n=1 Tax=Mucilaginibacter sp. TaxID=1882438 RepID=UPI002BFD9516|nr:hypothetical protein [Mucilaginibacter sp.]HTI59081.1 hypothetical protein [Mucilaginibacter sp.]